MIIVETMDSMELATSSYCEDNETAHWLTTEAPGGPLVCEIVWGTELGLPSPVQSWLLLFRIWKNIAKSFFFFKTETERPWKRRE